MELRILGPLEVRDGGRSVPLGGPRQRSLLAALVLHAGAAVSVERLVADLWADAAPPSAGHAVQVLVSKLRQALGPGGHAIVVTRPPGYAFDGAAVELDLTRFERLCEEGRRALGDGRPEAAAATLREALGLWRGPPLADVAGAPFVSLAVPRLEELRLTAVESRLEADLAAGRHAQLVGELEALCAAEPLRERLRGQLMVALYRCGRQAEALERYREGRALLARELGLEPSPAVQRLERAILQQDPALELPRPAPAAAPVAAAAPARAILLAPSSPAALAGLVELAAPLARAGGHELVLAVLVQEAGALADAARLAGEQRAALVAGGVRARAAAFTSARMAEDLVRLAGEQRADLVLVDVEPAALDAGPLPDRLRALLEQAPCDVGLLVARPGGGAGRPLLVPFGGGEHEWAALEVAAWLAASRGVGLRLLGADADEAAGRRDASRLLAHAALAVQQLSSVDSQPLLVAPGVAAAVAAAAGAGLCVVGLPDDWRTAGLGASRAALVREASPPVLLVGRGRERDGQAPGEGLTRFTWSLASPR